MRCRLRRFGVVMGVLALVAAGAWAASPGVVNALADALAKQPAAKSAAKQPAAKQPAARKPAVKAAAKPAVATQPTAVKPPWPKPSAELQKVLDGGVPAGIEQIRSMQDHVRKVAAYVTKATVGVRVSGSSGSGVIVTADGYVLTCAHVTRAADSPVTVILPDGSRVQGKTRGAYFGMDAGLIKITDKPKTKAGWPFCPMGKSSTLKLGQWCIAAGHPGGFRPGRTAPVRLGRVLRFGSSAIVSDCTIVSGDSGGPLFNTAGEVIGISSRIGGPLDANLHVPVDAYTKDWTRLTKGDTWGSQGRGNGAYLGVRGEGDGSTAKISYVQPGSAAARGGLKAGDVIKKFDSKPVTTYASLVGLIIRKRPGNKVKIVVQRGTKTVNLDITLGKRGG